jgi:hypothetical protein
LSHVSVLAICRDAKVDLGPPGGRRRKVKSRRRWLLVELLTDDDAKVRALVDHLATVRVVRQVIDRKGGRTPEEAGMRPRGLDS